MFFAFLLDVPAVGGENLETTRFFYNMDTPAERIPIISAFTLPDPRSLVRSMDSVTDFESRVGSFEQRHGHLAFYGILNA